eukprot:6971137-Prorocentrum_lima.AAC.1
MHLEIDRDLLACQRQQDGGDKKRHERHILEYVVGWTREPASEALVPPRVLHGEAVRMVLTVYPPLHMGL